MENQHAGRKNFSRLLVHKCSAYGYYFCGFNTLGNRLRNCDFYFTLVWVLIFPGVLWISHRLMKAYWVIFKKEEVLRHGFYGQLKQKKKISYDEAAYILTGEAEPFVTPRPNLGPWYHRKFGDYLNVLDAQKHCLFTVRYSQENLNLLMEKCIHAQLMDIQTYRAKEKNH